MFDGATKELPADVCPVIPIHKGPKFRVFIKTRYATIEQMFSEKDKALDFLETTRKSMDVIAYEIKTLEG
jgi:hypothetical protein